MDLFKYLEQAKKYTLSGHITAAKALVDYVLDRCEGQKLIFNLSMFMLMMLRQIKENKSCLTQLM